MRSLCRMIVAGLVGVTLAACGASTGAPVVSNWPGAGVATPAPGVTVVLPQKATPSATAMPTATAPPAPTPTPEPWRFVVLGDTRTEGLKPPNVTYAIVEHARSAQPQVVLCVGDMINALDSQAEVREQWRFWREAVAPLGAEHLLVTPGNHDVQGHAWATDLLVEAFPELPTNGPAGFERRAYALDYNGVRFISLDSEQFGGYNQLGDVQLEWLEAQLRDNPNRYTIVFSHAPAYPVGPHVGSSLDVVPRERDRLWQLLRDYKVAAYVTGHEHLYNRQEIAGVQQIIAGTSGSWPYGGFGGDFFHYVVAEVGSDGLSFVVYDQEGQERDRVVLH